MMTPEASAVIVAVANGQFAHLSPASVQRSTQATQDEEDVLSDVDAMDTAAAIVLAGRRRRGEV